MYFLSLCINLDLFTMTLILLLSLFMWHNKKIIIGTWLHEEIFNHAPTLNASCTSISKLTTITQIVNMKLSFNQKLGHSRSNWEYACSLKPQKNAVLLSSATLDIQTHTLKSNAKLARDFTTCQTACNRINFNKGCRKRSRRSFWFTLSCASHMLSSGDRCARSTS